MPSYDFISQRLYVDSPLGVGAAVPCTPEQANYLGNVLRLADGTRILIFNGRDGEWLAHIVRSGKRALILAVEAQTRQQQAGPQIDYLFAPLKRARLDYMVQKAVEMGVATLSPVITRHTVADRVNLERMRANAIEAAEQCGILYIPSIAQTQKLEAALATWDPTIPLIHCDETAPVADPIDALKGVRRGRVGVLIGPEGGFAPDERDKLARMPGCLRIALGPRILRADTAAVAVLALVGAVIGDWSTSERQPA